jgi:uncharacterized caspase-like protein
LLTGSDATRGAILESLEWLATCTRAEPDADTTVVIYYSGHGWRDSTTDPPTYYLIPYDVREDAIRSRALRVDDFAEELRSLQVRRLLVMLDCCHSGGMEVKSASIAAAGYEVSAVPPGLLMPDPAAASAKGLEELSQGSGWAVLSSSQGDQSSWVRRDRAMSIFTYHVIEALLGHSQPPNGATDVLVSDVMSHVSRQVPRSAAADWKAVQQPDYQVSGNFPIALLLGGKGLAIGANPPVPDLAPPAADGAGSVTVSSPGERSVAIGGGTTGTTIITGNNSRAG